MTYDADKDYEVQNDLAHLEGLAESITLDSYNCKVTDIFLDNIGIIGGLHRKYTGFTFLPKDSKSAKRFDAAIRKAKDAKIKFVRDCECKMK